MRSSGGSLPPASIPPGTHSRVVLSKGALWFCLTGTPGKHPALGDWGGSGHYPSCPPPRCGSGGLSQAPSGGRVPGPPGQKLPLRAALEGGSLLPLPGPGDALHLGAGPAPVTETSKLASFCCELSSLLGNGPSRGLQTLLFRATGEEFGLPCPTGHRPPGPPGGPPPHPGNLQPHSGQESEPVQPQEPGRFTQRPPPHLPPPVTRPPWRAGRQDLPAMSSNPGSFNKDHRFGLDLGLGVNGKVADR